MAIKLTSNVERQVLGDRFQKATTHVLNGVPAAALDPISTFSGYQVFSTDFLIWTGPATGGTAGGWQVDDVGTSVVALEDSAQFGSVQFQTGGTEDNNCIAQVNGEPWRYVVGKKLWCFARLNVSDADDMEAIFGLAISTADPIGGTFPTDGIFFEKAETATEFDFHARKNGASTERTLVSTTMTDGGYRILGFVVDAAGNVTAYDGSTLDNLTAIATVATGNANLPDDEDLSLIFGAETGGGAAKDITVDWVFVAQER